jgi:pyruvate formate lyase activating enzyme
MIPIAAIQHFSLSDYPGVPSCIVFTQGCNLACSYCHNKSLIPMTHIDHYYWKDGAYVFNFLNSRMRKIEGLVLTGGEPLIHSVGVVDFLGEVKNLGYKVKLDTNGTFPETLEYVLKAGLVDYVAMDIKAPWGMYDRITPVGTHTEDSVRASLDILSKGSVPFEVRTTFYERVLNEEDLAVIKSYLPSGVLHRVNECSLSNTVS